MCYMLCVRCFREGHTPGIQTLTNENVRFKYLIVGVASNASDETTISSENARRTQYRTSVRVESIIIPLFFIVWRKIEC